MPNDYCSICGNPKAECTCGNDDGWHHALTVPHPTEPFILTFAPYLLTLVTGALVGALVERWDAWGAVVSWWSP